MSESVEIILNSLAHDASVFGRAQLNGPTRAALAPYVRADYLRKLHEPRYTMSLWLSPEMLADFSNEVRKGIVARVAAKLTA